MLEAGMWIFLAMSVHGFVDIGIIDKGAARLLYMMLGLALSYACTNEAADHF